MYGQSLNPSHVGGLAGIYPALFHFLGGMVTTLSMNPWDPRYGLYSLTFNHKINQHV